MSLPYPTPTRLALADDIAAGNLAPAVTARVAELAAAGLVHVDIRLTSEGMAWVTRARTRDSGPGSTSPEPGPQRACNCNPELFGGKHRWQCPSVPAAVVLNDVGGALSTEDGA